MTHHRVLLHRGSLQPAHPISPTRSPRRGCARSRPSACRTSLRCPTSTVVVALKSRSIEAEAVTLSRAADRWLRAQGAGHVLFKICSTFDSTDAGNIGPVTDALVADADDPIALVTPAFPETGRTVYQGNRFVGAVPLNEGRRIIRSTRCTTRPAARARARQSRNKVGLVDLFTVAQGVEAIRVAAEGPRWSASAPRSRMRSSSAIWSSSGLRRSTIASRSAPPASGSGWRAGSSRAAVCKPRRPPRSARRSADRPHALREAARRRRSHRSRRRKPRCLAPRLDPDALIADDAAVEKALAWALERLDRGAILIASSATPERSQRCSRGGRTRRRRSCDRAGIRVARVRPRRARRAPSHRCGRRTPGAVVDRLGIPAFRIGPEIAAGVPVLRTVGMKDEMALTLKSGNFGGPRFFSDALALVQ